MDSRRHDYVVTLHLIPPRTLPEAEVRRAVEALVRERPDWVLAVRVLDTVPAVELTCARTGLDAADAVRHSVDTARSHFVMDRHLARWMVDARGARAVGVDRRTEHNTTEGDDPTTSR